MKISNYPFPKEHGGWVMLIVPLLAGFILAWPLVPGRTFWYLLLVFNAFFLRHLALQSLRGRKDLKGWMGIHAFVLAGAGLELVFVEQLWRLIPFGLILGLLLTINLVLARSRKLAFWGNTIGIIALSGMAPLTIYVETGHWGMLNTQIWVWMALLFVGSAFFVKGRINRKPSPGEAFLYLLIPSLGFIFSEIAALMGLVPSLWPLAFLFPLGKTLWVYYKKDVRWSLPKIGILETTSSFFFLLVLLGTAGQWI